MSINYNRSTKLDSSWERAVYGQPRFDKTFGNAAHSSNRFRVRFPSDSSARVRSLNNLNGTIVFAHNDPSTHTWCKNIGCRWNVSSKCFSVCNRGNVLARLIFGWRRGLRVISFRHWRSNRVDALLQFYHLVVSKFKSNRRWTTSRRSSSPCSSWRWMSSKTRTCWTRRHRRGRGKKRIGVWRRCAIRSEVFIDGQEGLFSVVRGLLVTDLSRRRFAHRAGRPQPVNASSSRARFGRTSSSRRRFLSLYSNDFPNVFHTRIRFTAWTWCASGLRRVPTTWLNRTYLTALYKYKKLRHVPENDFII